MTLPARILRIIVVVVIILVVIAIVMIIMIIVIRGFRPWGLGGSGWTLSWLGHGSYAENRWGLGGRCHGWDMDALRHDGVWLGRLDCMGLGFRL